MVVCGQQHGLKALRQAHLHRFWSIGTKRYSTKQVSTKQNWPCSPLFFVSSFIQIVFDALIAIGAQRRHNLKIASVFSALIKFVGNLINTLQCRIDADIHSAVSSVFLVFRLCFSFALSTRQQLLLQMRHKREISLESI